MLSRRDLVGKLAAGTAAVCVAGVARATVGGPRQETDTNGSGQSAPDAHASVELRPKLVDAEAPATLSAPAPWELLRPLTLGATVAHGWRVAALSGAVDGSCVLTLENARGRSHRVHLCRNDGHPSGVVYTKRFDLLVMNGGEGDLPTNEGLAQALAEVAHVLAANEESQEPIVTALLPHEERVRLFSGDLDRRLR
jgi:hypothetical protein